MKQRFNKPATTFEQQVDLLRQRGMLIADAESARHYLQHLNYYRLGAYWLPFEANHATHKFKPGVRFEDVINLYIFDRELRLLVMDAIERLEVSVRCQWAHHLAHRHGPHAHLEQALFDSRYWSGNLDKLREEVGRSDEAFIRHYRQKYAESLPPTWAACEVMSLGVLSRWYDSLKPKSTRRAIAETYCLDDQVLQSWLHHLTVTRNVCAHHARLWNREFSVIPVAPKTKPKHLADAFASGSRKLYNTLVILAHGMDIVAKQHHWRPRLIKLIETHDITVALMGFPEDWRQRDIWREVA